MAALGVAMLAGAVLIYRNALRESAAPATPGVADSAPAPVPALEAPPADPAPSPPPSAPAARTPAPGREPVKRTDSPADEAPVTRAATTGTLTVTADVNGAQVFLDRQFIGATPVTAADVAPGSHQLNVSAPGFEPIVQTIEVAPGPRDIAIRFREVRLDLALDVIHRHRLGSCRGRLVATPQGLRYESSDKDDAFSTGLLDLETFQVDYLAKTLRIQARRGRRYEFTDPEGNADRLFVFHRDVDKARTQLRKGDTP